MLNVQYVTDTNGKPLYVQVPIKEYEKLLADAEELADIAAYRKAKKKPSKSLSFDEAFKQIEAHHDKRASCMLVTLSAKIVGSSLVSDQA